MTSVSHVTAMYATKRRRRNSKNVRTVCTKNSPEDTNASKRHRERLNKELDNLAELLPYEQSVLSKLDKLSILRLSVSYLRTKSYFQAALASGRLASPQRLAYGQQQQPQQQFRSHHQLEPRAPSQGYPAELRTEGDLVVQALNGFLLILTCDGEVFYTSHTVETYLGFHQSDICHQSVYELVHSEDREDLMQQLRWNSLVPQPSASAAAAADKSQGQLSLAELLASADHRHLLERNFTVRFRCLLDNTSGFLRLDIRGRIKVLHGQQNQHNLANSGAGLASGADSQQRDPLLAFFGVCIPFGPPSLLEMPTKDSVFKSKHRLDLSLISMDSRGKQLLGLNDLNHSSAELAAEAEGAGSPKLVKLELGAASSPAPAPTPTTPAASRAHQLALNAVKQKANLSAYDLVHHDDLSYMASAHQELLKTGASGLIAYRMVVQPEAKYQWLQSSAKLYYKNSKPDFILCTHRPLMEEEGRDLLGKRTMDFKVTYLDVGPASSAAIASGPSSASPFGGSGKLSSCDMSGGAKAAHQRYLHSASPGESLASSRSSGSLSPSAAEQSGKSRLARAKLYSQPQYDLSQHQYSDDPYAAAADTYALADPMSYAKSQRAPPISTFYDMDAGADQLAAEQLARAKGQSRKKPVAAGKAAKQSGSTKKQRLEAELKQSTAARSGAEDEQQQVAAVAATAAAAAAAAAALHHHHHHQPMVAMDHQQLHLYGHYNNHAHLAADHDSANTTSSAAYAAYAASGASNHSHHHNPYAHHHQSLYGGATTMVSPVTSYSAQSSHHHHHLHTLDSAAAAVYHHHQTSGAHHNPYTDSAGAVATPYNGTGSSASSSGFLPATEHLLHHYSQSARNAAAAHLAAWPAISSGTQPPSTTEQYYSGGSATTNAWASALGAASAQDSRQYASQPSETSSPPRGAATSAKLSQRYGLDGQQKSAHGPASLNSDGSTHRSPLSSGESSNGSGCLANPAASALAAVSGGATSSSSASAPTNEASTTNVLSPASYYLGEHQQQQVAAAAAAYGAYPSSYARQHYATGDSTAHQYASLSAQHNQQQQQHQSTQSQHNGNQYHGQQAVDSRHNQYHGYFQANDLSGAETSGSSSAAAIKLYGAASNAAGEPTDDTSYYGQPATWIHQPEYAPLLVKGAETESSFTGDADWSASGQLERVDEPLVEKGNGHVEAASAEADGVQNDTDQEVASVNKTIEDSWDPLARLISSTIGDIMLDATSKV